MRINHIRPLVAAAVSACALLALGATSAVAAPTWTTAGSATASGSLTVKLNGGNAKTCTFNAWGNASNSAGYATLNLVFGSPTWINIPCSGNTTLQMRASNAFVDGGPGSYTVEFYGDNASSPYGGTYSNLATPDFVNGTGGAQSTIVFDDTYIGENAFANVLTATGTLTVTDNSYIGGPSTGTRTLTGSW
jgi:hypothetical protein